MTRRKKSIAVLLTVVALSALLVTGCDSSSASNGGTSNALSGTSWVIDDLDNKDSDPDLDDRVVAFASDGSFYGVWYDDYTTDLSDPTTDDPMSGSGVDQANPSGDRGSYTVSGDTVEITINEVYDGSGWTEIPAENYSSQFEVSGDTLSVVFEDGQTREFVRVE